MNLIKIITGVCSLFFFLIGIDKFYPFMEPACSLMNEVPSLIWKGLGVIQVISGILIWMPKYRKYVAGFFFVFMIVFTIVHLTQDTYDIGGAIFMAVLLGLIVWDPGFLKGKKS